MFHGYKQFVLNYFFFLFYQNQSNTFTNLVIYIDDIVMFGNNVPEISHIITFLNDIFKINDLDN